ncbi:MAG TPA: hypothetical protein VKR06_32250 [Ktedonosporobacter sp.]|nr:hypothetical protein [Ktedonosporobacter sp.]
MHYEPRNSEADAKFIEAGGLKSWGCYAVLLAVIILLILFAIVRALLINLIADPAASWGALLFLAAVVAETVYLWKKRRRKLRMEQEHMWQMEMERGSQKKEVARQQQSEKAL